jgi:uncharacterized membrane protein
MTHATRLHRAALVLALATALLLWGDARARFEWRDVVQRVDLQRDGSVLVVDERTLWTTTDFGDAFLCVLLAPGERLTLLEGTGAVSPGPTAWAVPGTCVGGAEVIVRQDARVHERRVRFVYRLDGTIDAHGDVVQWYWNILERDRPPVVGYRLTVTAPGPMEAPFDAYVMRYANPERPRVALSSDRSVLEVAFDRVPSDEGVEIRWLMPPALFDVAGSGRPAFERLLREQARVSGVQERDRLFRAVRGHAAWGLLPLAALSWLGAGVFRAWRRTGREPRSEVMRYPFEPPRDLPPAIVTTLLAQGSPKGAAGQAWFATIMDLARRRYLRFEGEGRRLVIHLERERADDRLETFERSVLTYLRSAAASGRSAQRDPDSVTIAELSAYGRTHAQGFQLAFGRAISAWGEGFYGGPYTTPESRAERDRWTLRGALAAAFCGLLLWALVDHAAVAAGIGLGLAVLTLVVAAASLPAWRPDIAQERAEWLAFRRTLTDFTRMRDAPHDFYELWDRLYVYAAALGVAERFLRTLARAAPRAGVDEASLVRRGAWLGTARASDLVAVSRSVSQLSGALASAGASASSGGSSAGGGGGGGGGSSGGR